MLITNEYWFNELTLIDAVYYFTNKKNYKFWHFSVDIANFNVYNHVSIHIIRVLRDKILEEVNLSERKNEILIWREH